MVLNKENLLDLDRIRRNAGGHARPGSSISVKGFFFDCPRQVIFGRTEENASDGNLFDEAHDTACLRIDYPPPQTHQNLEGWKEYYGLDSHSTRAAMTGDFDPDTLTLTWKVDGPLPECPDVPELYGVGEYAGPGPLNAAEWKQLAGGKKITVTFDLPGAKR